MTIRRPPEPPAAATIVRPPGGETAALIVPKIQDETGFDRVSSLLMATIVTAGIIVVWLGLVYLTNLQAEQVKAKEIRIIEVAGGEGGQQDGQEDSTESIDVPDAAAAAFASNNELTASDFEEPSLQQTPSAMLEAMVQQDFADLAEEMDRGGEVASGVRASKLGTGAAAYGLGDGDGGVPREQRWSVLYNPGQTIEEYARQLDYFGVEMATIKDGRMYYAVNFSKSLPDTRSAARGNDDRLYFLWQGGGRRESDIQLLQKAGIQVGPRDPIFQFYPEAAENQLAQLEVQHAGRQPQEIRTTKFQVVPTGNRYAFKVMDQQYVD